MIIFSMNYLEILPEEILSIIIYLLNYESIENLVISNELSLLERIIKNEVEYEQLVKNVFYDKGSGDAVLTPYKCYEVINNLSRIKTFDDYWKDAYLCLGSLVKDMYDLGTDNKYFRNVTIFPEILHEVLFYEKFTDIYSSIIKIIPSIEVNWMIICG